MIESLQGPWPWYVGGPLIGVIVLLLLLVGGKAIGTSENLRHMCAAFFPGQADLFKYDWRRQGLWNLTFLLGIVLGSVIAAVWLRGPGEPVGLSEATRADLAALGISTTDGIAPKQIFSWSGLLTLPGFLIMVVGGFLVGFGTRYAGGCSSGHGLSGLANLQLPSLIAVAGFFAGGIAVTFVVLPWIFRS